MITDNDYGIRAPDRQTALNYLLKRGILLEQSEEGLRFAEGVAFDEHPISIVLKPAVFDKEGNLVSEAVLDSNYHANLRLSDRWIAELDKGGATTTNLSVSKVSAKDQQITKAIANRVVDSVTIFKIKDLNTPARVWL